MRLKFVSRLFLAAVVVLIGTFASANSSSNLNFNTTGGWGYAYGYSYSGWSELYGASYSSHGGAYNDTWFDVWNGNGNMKNFASGDFEDEFGKGNSYGYIYGGLSNIIFNSSLGKLTANFNGWAEIDNNGNWSFTYFDGTFTQKMTLTQYYGCSGCGYQYLYGANGGGTITGIPNGFGPSAIGIAQTPEPGSLVLMGTGLLGIAGIVKRKLLYAKSTNL